MNHAHHRRLFSFLVLVALVPLSLSLSLTRSVTASAAPYSASDSGWLQMSAGQSRWFNFSYAGDRSQVEVRLEVLPQGSATFAVWTPDQVLHLSWGDRAQPVGRGAADPLDPGTLLWSGNFPVSGTYSVVVERPAGQTWTAYYRLQVSGSGASLDTTPPTPTPTPVVRSQPKTALASKLTGKIVFQTTYGGPFYTVNADGTDLKRITNGIDPVWSPDGSQIAFVRWEEPRGVWVVNADGSGERRVFDEAEARSPSWSADGSQIVFSRKHGEIPGQGQGNAGASRRRGPPGGGGGPGGASDASAWRLAVVNVGDGSLWEPQGNSDYNWMPAWSAAGDQIVFKGVYGLQVLKSAHGSEWYQLTSDQTDMTPVWSPALPEGSTGGRTVAFVRRQHDHWEIWTVDADGGHLRRLTQTPTCPDGTAGSSVSPAWSPDGKWIAFLTNRTGQWEIWFMAADGSHPQPMFDPGSELSGLTLHYAFANERALSWTQ